MDDEEMILVSLKDQLRDHFAKEYSIETVDSGDEALEFFKELLEEDVDVPLLISDEIMPGMKGHELLSHVHELSPRTLKVLLTGQADARAVGDSVNAANLYRYIAKPWEETDLILTIKEAIRSFYQDKKLEEQNVQLRQMNENLESLVVERTVEVVRQKDEIQKQVEDLDKQRRELEVRNDFIRNIFGRYVTDEVMITLLENPEALEFGGEKREITVLMSDLRGFTALSERLSPERVVTMLNHYLGVMVDVIAKYNGTILEFLGDGIMVIFGAPRPLEKHAQYGISCAIAMQQAMEQVNAYNSEHGFPAVEMGIGINTGDVVVGNIGSDRRAKYGVVGQTVNLTARIETLATGNQILVSEHALASVREKCEIVDEVEVSVKGAEKPLKLFEVSGIQGEEHLHLDKREVPLVALESSIDSVLWLLEGKSVSKTVHDARILKFSRKESLITTDRSLERYDNIKMQWQRNGGDAKCEVYAKVRRKVDDGYLVRFTSVPPETESFIAEVTSK